MQFGYWIDFRASGILLTPLLEHCNTQKRGAKNKKSGGNPPPTLAGPHLSVWHKLAVSIWQPAQDLRDFQMQRVPLREVHHTTLGPMAFGPAATNGKCLPASLQHTSRSRWQRICERADSRSFSWFHLLSMQSVETSRAAPVRSSR